MKQAAFLEFIQAKVVWMANATADAYQPVSIRVHEGLNEKGSSDSSMHMEGVIYQ